MNNSRKVIIGVLLILTLVLAGVAAYVAINLSGDPDDVSVGAGYCPPITCADGTQFGEDPNTPHDTCAARANEACASHGGVGGGGGTTNTCSGANNNNACQNVGQIVAIGGNQTCVCTRTTENACSCVPTSGTSCTAGVNDPDATECTAVGGSCTKDDGRLGTCFSQGNRTQGSLSGLACGCQAAPNQSGGGVGDSCLDNANCLSNLVCTGGTCQQPSTQPQCTRTSDCPSGQYCNTVGGGTCYPKIGTSNPCAAAGTVRNGTQSESCVSGICTTSASNPNGTCTVAGTGANACDSNNPCPSGQFCSPTSFTCQTPGGVGADCTSDSACQSGLACLSLRCRQPVDDSGAATGGACTSGQWYCGSTYGCAAGSGKLCSNGTITGASCAVADACAGQVSGQLQTGMSCAGLTRLSAGESLNGSFVGCSGRLNCFCAGIINVGTSYPASTTATVNCIADVGNDSCGASGPTPTPPPTNGGGGGGGGGGGTTQPPPTQTVEPYCGDAICQSGELCERTTPGASTYLSCSTQTPVAECRDIGTAAPTPASACSYCGDGIVNGPEQCDYNAPGTTDCNTSCQNIVAACVALTENGPDPIRSGAGNVIEYTLVYTNANTGDPYPSIRLRVGSEGTPVGRDANATSQQTVAPFAAPAANDTGSTKIYKFLWEAATTGGAAVADGTYDVRVLLNGLDSSVITVASCQESITVAADAAQAPLFTITKSSAEVCLANGDAQIDYTVNVTNNGPIESEIDQVQDTLDADIVAAGITPTNITPSYGTYSNGVITWIGSESDRTYTSGQTKAFTYTLIIPETQLVSFHNSGVDNTVTVTYGSNTSTFEVNTPITCALPTVPTYIPATSLVSDSSRSIIFGAMFIVMGVLVYKYNAHLIMFNALGSFGLLKNITLIGASKNTRGSDRYEEAVMKRAGKSTTK